MGQRARNLPFIALAAAILAVACSRTGNAEKELTATIEVTPAFDPGSMTVPPTLAEVTGNDAASRAKAEEVYFRCSKVPRPERKDNAWCQLRDRIY